MTLVFKVLGIVAVCAVLALILKSRGGEYAFLISAVCALSVFVYVLSGVIPEINKVKRIISENTRSGDYIEVALKSVFIALLSEAVASVCRDFNQSALAFAAETAGKAMIFILCLPLFSGILEIALEFLKL